MHEKTDLLLHTQGVLNTIKERKTTQVKDLGGFGGDDRTRKSQRVCCLMVACDTQCCRVLQAEGGNPLELKGLWVEKSSNACPAMCSGDVAPRTRRARFGDAFGDEDGGVGRPLHEK